MNKTVSVSSLDRRDAANVARWDAYVAAAPSATFFHRSAWQGILNEVFGHATFFLYAERDGMIIGVLPLAQINSRLFGNALVALPFAVYGGIVADDAEAVSALESEAERIARQLDVEHLEYRNTAVRHPDWPTQELYVTFKRSIPDVLDDRMLCIPQKRRNMVRKAIKLGLYSTYGDLVDDFYPVFAENARDHGTPVLPKRYFRGLLQIFGRDCEILTIRSREGRPLSSILCFYFRDHVMAYYAGEVAEAKNMAANDLKYWELMKRAAHRGCRVFDLGRSKKGTGSYEFKRTWGFEASQLSYEYVLLRRNNIPQNNPMNPKYRVFIALWKRLPLPMANLIGPLLVRNLG
jgi:FemAB-related protein (PEP-CTERM system-associated)